MMTNSNTQQSENITISLPDDPAQAIGDMIALTEKLTGLMEEENRALISSDSIAFLAALGSKEKTAARYQAAAQEFQARLEDFRGIDPALLDRLEATQNRLGQITRENTAYMKPLNDREGKE